MYCDGSCKGYSILPCMAGATVNCNYSNSLLLLQGYSCVINRFHHTNHIAVKPGRSSGQPMSSLYIDPSSGPIICTWKDFHSSHRGVSRSTLHTYRVRTQRGGGVAKNSGFDSKKVAVP
jgi:hypothetical protein